jgi:N-methylhydantoinase B
VILGAFQRALPNLMPAGPGSSAGIMNVKTIDAKTGRRIMASINPMTGGAGGSSFGDGADGSGANSSFLKNTPVEINEAEVPIRFRRYALVPDSGGPGKSRGGLATEMEFQLFSPNSVVTARNRDRTRFSTWGAVGGGPGATSSFHRNPESNHAEDLGNTDVVTLDPGDVIRIVAAGGAGWGHAHERDPALVLRDIRQGKVSIEAAARDYGVVVAAGRVDEAATKAARARLAEEAARRPPAHFRFNAARDAFEAVWTDANYDALTEVLATLPVHWRHFVKRRIFDRFAAIAAAERKTDGSDIRRLFAAAVGEFPELRHLHAKVAAE